MTALGVALAPEIVAACQAGRDEIAAALTRALDRSISIAIGAVEPFSVDQHAAELQTAGLALALRVGDRAAVCLLPATGGLLPDWYQAPDPTGQSKLTTLAQELSMLVLPETIMADDFVAGGVDNLHAALERAAPDADAQRLPLVLSSDDGAQATLTLVWGVDSAGALLAPPTDAAVPADKLSSPPISAAAGPGNRARPDAPHPASEHAPPNRATVRRIEELPNYVRSLLRVRVPVTVTLAAVKQPIANILDLGPGSLIQFEKPCDELLDLEVGGKVIGQGEAVKVGDKFGMRVTAMTVPGENFRPVRKPA